MRILTFITALLLFCNNIHAQVELIVLGNVQDAGSPQINCKKDCCKRLFDHPDRNRKVVSLGLTDHKQGKKYLFEATPDMVSQMDLLQNASFPTSTTPDGIFLTHAHIGHYTGLMFLGKEAMNANKVPVYAMPQMKTYLETNGPWSQLVKTENISIQSLQNNVEVRLSEELRIIPFQVPHRDEYSETVGYKIIGPTKSALFIPDIDKWEKWEKDIIAEIATVDYAFIDATFYDAEEINNRDISTIPHPFVVESMNAFEYLSKAEKGKVYFIHFNHTNPLLNPGSRQTKKVLKAGFRIARLGDKFRL